MVEHHGLLGLGLIVGKTKRGVHDDNLIEISTHVGKLYWDNSNRSRFSLFSLDFVACRSTFKVMMPPCLQLYVWNWQGMMWGGGRGLKGYN